MSDEPSAKLLTIEECFASTNVTTIRTQIKLRRGIEQTLVGSLYPSIIEGEIARLEALLAEMSKSR